MICMLTEGVPVYAEEIEEGKLYAKAAVLMDADSKRVLFEKNGSTVLPMASTTKIMTCIVALENCDITKPVEISKKAAGMPDVQLNAKASDSFYMVDLLYSLMLESHNDSAVAIAEGVAGSVEGFADMMNQKARELGCTNTYYITPNGLDAQNEQGTHSTTAVELARIMAYCVNESPQKDAFLKITQTPNYMFHNVKQNEDGTWSYAEKTYSVVNHNAFLQMMEGAESGKTGFTGNAGYCYVGSLKRDGKHLIAVVLACGWPPHKTRKWSDVKQLMQYGISEYTYHNLAEAKIDAETLTKPEVLDGQSPIWNEPIAAELEIVENSEQNECEGLLLKADEKIEVKVTLPETIQAPVAAGKAVGKVEYLVGENIYKEDQIIVKNEVKKIDYAFCLQRLKNKFFGGIF